MKLVKYNCKISFKAPTINGVHIISSTIIHTSIHLSCRINFNFRFYSIRSNIPFMYLFKMMSYGDKKIKDSFWYKRRIFIISRCQRNFNNALKWNSIFMFILEHLWNLISRTVQNQINHIKLILKKLKSSNFSNFWKFFLSRSVAYLYYFAIIEGNWIIFTF